MAEKMVEVSRAPAPKQVSKPKTTGQCTKIGKLIFVGYYIAQQLALVAAGIGVCAFGMCDVNVSPHLVLAASGCFLSGLSACIYYIGHLSGCGVCLGRPQRNFLLLCGAALGAGLAAAAAVVATSRFVGNSAAIPEDVTTNISTTVSTLDLTWLGCALVFAHAVSVLAYERWYAVTGIDLHRLVLLRPQSVLSATFYCPNSQAPVEFGRQAAHKAPSLLIAHRGSSCPFASTFMLQAVDMLDALREGGVRTHIISTERKDAQDMAAAYGISQAGCSCSSSTAGGGGSADKTAKGGGGPGACASQMCRMPGHNPRCVCIYDEGGRELKRLGVAREQPNPLVSWRSLFCTLFGGGHSEPVACPTVLVLDHNHRIIWRYVAADYRVWPEIDELRGCLAHSFDLPDLLGQQTSQPLSSAVSSRTPDHDQSDHPQDRGGITSAPLETAKLVDDSAAVL